MSFASTSKTRANPKHNHLSFEVFSFYLHTVSLLPQNRLKRKGHQGAHIKGTWTKITVQGKGLNVGAGCG